MKFLIVEPSPVIRFPIGPKYLWPSSLDLFMRPGLHCGVHLFTFIFLVILYRHTNWYRYLIADPSSASDVYRASLIVDFNASFLFICIIVINTNIYTIIVH